MKVSLSMPHPLFGTHGQLFSEINELKAKLEKLRIKLPKVKRKEQQDLVERRALVKKLVADAGTLNSRVHSLKGEARQAAQDKLKQLNLQIRWAQIGPKEKDSIRIQREIDQAKHWIDELQHKHDAAKALLILYAIRRWED